MILIINGMKILSLQQITSMIILNIIDKNIDVYQIEKN